MRNYGRRAQSLGRPPSPIPHSTPQAALQILHKLPSRKGRLLLLLHPFLGCSPRHNRLLPPVPLRRLTSTKTFRGRCRGGRPSERKFHLLTLSRERPGLVHGLLSPGLCPTSILVHQSLPMETDSQMGLMIFISPPPLPPRRQNRNLELVQVLTLSRAMIGPFSGGQHPRRQQRLRSKLSRPLPLPHHTPLQIGHHLLLPKVPNYL